MSAVPRRTGGYDFLSYWCRAGSAMGTTPTDVDYLAGQPGPGYGDSIGGMTIAGGILGTLFHRERTGEALPVDVSLLGVGIWAMSPAVALSLQLNMPWRPGPSPRWRRRTGEPAGRYLSHAGRAIPRVLLLAGLQVLALGLPVIGREDLITDERFNSHEQLAANAGAAREILKEIFASAPLSDWKVRFDSFEGQWSVAQDSLEADDRPTGLGQRPARRDHHRRRHAVHARHHTGAVRRRAYPPKRAPEFNEHCDEILASIDLSDDEMMELKVAGVVA